MFFCLQYEEPPKEIQDACYHTIKRLRELRRKNQRSVLVTDQATPNLLVLFFLCVVSALKYSSVLCAFVHCTFFKILNHRVVAKYNALWECTNDLLLRYYYSHINFVIMALEHDVSTVVFMWQVMGLEEN